jgi:membrane protease YdiL (CAAX protease family)
MPSVPPPNTIAPDSLPERADQTPSRGFDVPPWPAWTAPAGVALGLALGVFGSVLVDAGGHAAGSSLSHPTPAVSLVSDLVFDLAFVAAALYFAILKSRPRPVDFGFRRVRPRLGIAAVLVAAIGYYLVTYVYGSLIKLHGSDKLPSELGVSKSTAALVGAAVFVCVIAPMAEEFFFRGFFFGALRRVPIVIGGRDIGTWVAAIVTGILFGIAHTGSASSQYLVPLGFLGFVLCLVRWKTASLYPCMALHSINNSLALGVNQLNWNAIEIVGLMVGSLAVIGAITGPLAGPRAGPRAVAT